MLRTFLCFLLPMLGLLCVCAQRMERLKFVRMDASGGLSDNRVQHIMQLPDGRMAVTTKGNINIYDGAEFRYIHGGDGVERELKDYSGAYHVYVDGCDNLWLKDYHRVMCFSLREERYLTDIDSVFRKNGADDEVTDLFIDSSRELWMVCGGCLIRGGAKPLSVRLPSEAKSLQDLDVADGRLYLFFSDGEVVCHDLRTARKLYGRKAYGAEEANKYALSSLVVKSPDGNFYQLRCGDGAVCLAFNPRTKTWKELLRTPYILHTIMAPSGDNLFVTSRESLLKITPATDDVVSVPYINVDGTDFATNCFNTIYRDMQGGIWVGTYDHGLLYAHEARFRLTSAKSLSDLGLPEADYFSVSGRTETFCGKNYTCVFTDSRGWTWCGSCDGLYLFRGDCAEAEVFYTEDGLSNNYIHAIAEDRNGDVWISTSYGLNRMTVKTGADSGIPTFAVESYGATDGTLKGEYADGMVAVLPDGRVLFGGVDGYTLLNVEDAAVPQLYTRPVLTGVSLNGKRLSAGMNSLPCSENFTANFDFAHDENTLSFDISSLNFALPEHTVFRYRIMDDDSEADTAWQVVRASASGGLVDSRGVLHLSLVKIPPGQYELQVQTVSVPQSDMLRIKFRIRPPWWKTPWAIAVWTLLLLGALVLAFLVYLRIMRMRMRRRHKEEILLMRIKGLIERCNEYEFAVNELREENTGKCGLEKTGCDDSEAADAQESEDNDFIRKAVELVERNLNTRGYNVEQLSRDLCMERTGLYKKMTQLLDKSPSLFIRSIRLRHAAQLLLRGNMSVAEIAERTGFSSSSHMSRCFQEEYGCAPSEYAGKKAVEAAGS